MKRSLPFFFLAALVLALAGGILVLVHGLTTPAVLLIAIGLGLGVGIAVRSGGLSKLGGMDERELSAAIRERARKNWDTAHDGRQQSRGRQQSGSQQT